MKEVLRGVGTQDLIMLLNSQKKISDKEVAGRGGEVLQTGVTTGGQVTHEELSVGEHAPDPGAVPLPCAFPEPAALTVAGRPGQSGGQVGRREIRLNT